MTENKNPFYGKNIYELEESIQKLENAPIDEIILKLQDILEVLKSMEKTKKVKENISLINEVKQRIIVLLEQKEELTAIQSDFLKNTPKEWNFLISGLIPTC